MLLYYDICYVKFKQSLRLHKIEIFFMLQYLCYITKKYVMHIPLIPLAAFQM